MILYVILTKTDGVRIVLMMNYAIMMIAKCVMTTLLLVMKKRNGDLTPRI